LDLSLSFRRKGTARSAAWSIPQMRQMLSLRYLEKGIRAVARNHYLGYLLQETHLLLKKPSEFPEKRYALFKPRFLQSVFRFFARAVTNLDLRLSLIPPDGWRG
jgi:hypothetical protein